MPKNPRPNEDVVTQGRVKTFNVDAGYGFIITPDIPEDVFFHITLCKKLNVCPGDVVTFGYKRMEDGRYRATRIIKVGDKWRCPAHPNLDADVERHVRGNTDY